jgi:hypothetical protein
VEYSQWCCSQHRALLGWRMAATMQTAWGSRIEYPEQYGNRRREALDELNRRLGDAASNKASG